MIEEDGEDGGCDQDRVGPTRPGALSEPAGGVLLKDAVLLAAPVALLRNTILAQRTATPAAASRALVAAE